MDGATAMRLYSICCLYETTVRGLMDVLFPHLNGVMNLPDRPCSSLIRNKEIMELEFTLRTFRSNYL